MFRIFLRLYLALSVLTAAFLAWRLPWRELLEPLPQPRKIVAGQPWVGVLGDSSVTGAAAHPQIQASWKALSGQAMSLLTEPREEQKLPVRLEDMINPKHYGIAEPDPVARVYYSPTEYPRKIPVLNWESKASLKLDSEELAFPYLASRRLGIPAPRIVVAGNDGAMVGQLWLQLDRLKQVSETLPPLLLISFVANDLCDPLVFKKPVAEFAAAYKESLKGQLNHIQGFKPDAKGTRIVFLPPLDLGNLLANPSLLAQRVALNGQQTTCGELRDSRTQPSHLSRLLQKVLIHECPAILETSEKATEHLQRIKDMQAAQVKVLEEETRAFNDNKVQGFEMVLASSVRHIAFQNGDLANDCFHPSARGHARIANALLANELRLQAAP